MLYSLTRISKDIIRCYVADLRIHVLNWDILATIPRSSVLSQPDLGVAARLISRLQICNGIYFDG
jgi:hypothetical protein